MDDRDVRLLKAIADLGTGSPERLHEETGIPVSTIHYRLNNLREAGVIENDCYDLDLDALGLGVTVILEVLTDYSGSHEHVAEDVEAIEGVTQLFSTMGETDYVAIARLTDGDDVGRLIRDFESVDAVERTNSTYVIDEIHEDSRGLSSYSMDTLLATLTDD
ncbi:Lrp/AsnC family transcriptional regulator [Halorubellus sp. JP-L1]|uniref:Lrp/AsnC family transcriptional regulator n=1 Tax=Halorubellus sp. JP-L1 TaxID=2715753 RepID=UPI00140CE578|nr:Lrp/AsnC family transcriptional regulator [Halorubellus sp. JP-L1]NHN42317.1 Lrp/AsnC family transcriptional regulator [Halorubellus sp. JP-L1]